MKSLFLALFLLLPFAAQAEETAPPAPAIIASDAPATVTPMPTSTRKWEMVAEDSSIIFSGKQMGKDFEGRIHSFAPQIYFDPDKLDQSKVVVDIDLRTIDANDSDRNKNLMTPDWLDIAQFPSARFETQAITRTGDNAYMADATLTIHGIIQEIQLPFTLTIERMEKGEDSGKDKAVMEGKVTLDRSKFQLGSGDWADPGVIANEIPVTVKVTALSDAPK